MTLGLEPGRDGLDGAGARRDGPEGGGAGERLVEVAVDAAGAGGARPFTYAVPDCAGRPPGRGGRARRVRAAAGARRRARPGAARRRRRRSPSSSGSAPMGRCSRRSTLALARWIAEHYLAPPALVIRAMLPPGLLERLELVAERTPTARRRRRRARRRRCRPARPARRSGARPARDLAAPDGRAGLLRRLRGLASRGLITLDWTLLGAGAGPALRALDPAPARRVGRRRQRWPPGTVRRAGRWVRARSRHSTELAGDATAPADGASRPRTSRDGTGPRPSRRSFGAAWRRPGSGSGRAGRWPRDAPGTRGGRPRSAELSGPQAIGRRPRRPGDRRARPAPAPARRRDGRRQDGHLRRGDRRVARGGPAGAGARARDRARAAAGRSAAGRPRCADRARPLRSRRRRTGRRVAPDPRRRRRHRRRDAAGGRRAARRRRASSSSTRSTTRRTRATGRPRLQARDTAIQLATLAGAALVLGSATPAVDSLGHGARRAPTTASSCRSGRSGPRRR